MGHDHSHAAGRAADRGRLKVALAVTATVMVVELVGAWLTGSLALLADAGHMATDAAAVVLALGASYVAARPAGPRSTFGWHRLEILAALVNALVLLGVCAYLAYAGIGRLSDPQAVDAGPMVAFALVGLLANAVSLAASTSARPRPRCSPTSSARSSPSSRASSSCSPASSAPTRSPRS